jgi:predicted nucleotidyltransferase
MRNIIQEIQEQLREIEKRENVCILHAVESGSRAWGFASPDSDYDVRFIYVRPVEEYLRFDEPRDVIEWQLDEVLDINGWDLKKAMKQFARGNATLFEWSNSPEIYHTTDQWAQVQRVSMNYFSEKSAVGHYYGLAENTYRDYLCQELVSYKKYFYALRPLLAARYIERFHQVPPVRFADLLGVEPGEELQEGIARLLERKRLTGEKERMPHMPVILRYIKEELQRQRETVKRLPDDHNRDWEELNRCFRAVMGYEVGDASSASWGRQNHDR